MLATVAGIRNYSGFGDGEGTEARFQYPGGMTVDRAGDIVLPKGGLSNFLDELCTFFLPWRQNLEKKRIQQKNRYKNRYSIYF